VQWTLRRGVPSGGIAGTQMLTKKRTLRLFPREKSARHLVVNKNSLFGDVGLPKVSTFYWLSGGEEWHIAIVQEVKDKQAMFSVSNTVRSTHNEHGAILLDIRQGQMFTVNFVGSQILELLKSGSTESVIADQISREFAVGRELAENDVRKFLRALKKCQLVEEKPVTVA
jgi:hypothetical protein